MTTQLQLINIIINIIIIIIPGTRRLVRKMESQLSRSLVDQRFVCYHRNKEDQKKVSELPLRNECRI